MTTKPYTFSTKAEKAYGLRDSNTVMAVVPGSNRISFSSTQRTTFQNRIFFLFGWQIQYSTFGKTCQEEAWFFKALLSLSRFFCPREKRMLRKAMLRPTDSLPRQGLVSSCFYT
jgi:hypothetical protein